MLTKHSKLEQRYVHHQFDVMNLMNGQGCFIMQRIDILKMVMLILNMTPANFEFNTRNDLHHNNIAKQ